MGNYTKQVMTRKKRGAIAFEDEVMAYVKLKELPFPSGNLIEKI